VAHSHESIKEEIVDWGIRNGQTLANMHLTQSHLDEQIQVEGELSEVEREAGIIEAASLKLEITLSKNNYQFLRKRRRSYHIISRQPSWK
jgi:hypothetical protein